MLLTCSLFINTKLCCTDLHPEINCLCEVLKIESVQKIEVTKLIADCEKLDQQKLEVDLSAVSDQFNNKLGLSWAKLSPSWGFKLEFEVEV